MSRRRSQLVVAIVLFFSAAYLIWQADSAMVEQYRFLRGCWPEEMTLNGTNLLTVDFWLDHVEEQDPGPIKAFFYSRVQHRIFFYLIGLCSLVGWSGSIFLKTVISEEGAAGGSPNAPPSWDLIISSLFLAVIGGAILFLLTVSARLAVADEQNCIPVVHGYFSAAGGLAVGLFVVLFFEWLKKAAVGIFEWVSGRVIP